MRFWSYARSPVPGYETGIRHRATVEPAPAQRHGRARAVP